MNEKPYVFGCPQPERYNQPWRFLGRHDNRGFTCQSCGTRLSISELITPHVPHYQELCPDCVPQGSEAYQAAVDMSNRAGREYGYSTTGAVTKGPPDWWGITKEDR